MLVRSSVVHIHLFGPSMLHGVSQRFRIWLSEDAVFRG